MKSYINTFRRYLNNTSSKFSFTIEEERYLQELKINLQPIEFNIINDENNYDNIFELNLNCFNNSNNLHNVKFKLNIDITSGLINDWKIIKINCYKPKTKEYLLTTMCEKIDVYYSNRAKFNNSLTQTIDSRYYIKEFFNILDINLNYNKKPITF